MRLQTVGTAICDLCHPSCPPASADGWAVSPANWAKYSRLLHRKPWPQDMGYLLTHEMGHLLKDEPSILELWWFWPILKTLRHRYPRCPRSERHIESHWHSHLFPIFLNSPCLTQMAAQQNHLRRNCIGCFMGSKSPQQQPWHLSGEPIRINHGSSQYVSTTHFNVTNFSPQKHVHTNS